MSHIDKRKLLGRAAAGAEIISNSLVRIMPTPVVAEKRSKKRLNANITQTDLRDRGQFSPRRPGEILPCSRRAALMFKVIALLLMRAHPGVHIGLF